MGNTLTRGALVALLILAGCLLASGCGDDRATAADDAGGDDAGPTDTSGPNTPTDVATPRDSGFVADSLPGGGLDGGPSDVVQAEDDSSPASLFDVNVSGLGDVEEPSTAWVPGDGSEGAVACLTDKECVENITVTQCTVARCHPLTHECFEGAAPIGTECDDEDDCTKNDQCLGGTCSGVPVTCNDDDVCTDDACRAGSGCVFEFNSGPCDDGKPCTNTDECFGGICIGLPKSCDDSDPCTLDSCDTVDGTCNHAHQEGVAGCSVDDPPEGESCCEPHDTAGCEDEGVQECACDVDSFCCEVEWDEICVDVATEDCEACGGGGGDPGPSCGDGACAGAETCGSCPADCGECPADSDCCTAVETPGCTDGAVQACVCAFDAWCCDNAWDAICVSEAHDDCEACGGGDNGGGGDPDPFCGDGTCDPDEGCGTCPADCGACGPVCGNGTCEDGEGCDDCAIDCGACPSAGCCAPQEGAGCPGDAALEACVCGMDAWCCDNQWDAICVNQAENDCGGCGGQSTECGDGVCEGTESCASCAADCGECGGGGADCDTPAVVEILALDLWAQPLVDFDLDVEVDGQSDNTPTGTLTSIALCDGGDVVIALTADQHDDGWVEASWSGVDSAEGLSIEVADVAGLRVTSDVRYLDGEQVRHYTLTVGLRHKWFASTGPPARHGNHYTLLMDGEEAWATVAADLTIAETDLVASSWWWKSEVELIRDEDTHIYTPAEERWLDTILGRMESMAAFEGVTTRVLINQFLTQDGWFSGLTMDDDIIDAAETPGDLIEMMGQANELDGTFTVQVPGVSFAGHVAAGWPQPSDAELTWSQQPGPFMDPYYGDSSALPFGVSLLDANIASWHQKFLVVDREVAYIGGMNVKTTDWDSSQHHVFEPRRMEFDATYAERVAVANKEAQTDFNPRKDYMVRLEGPSAADASDVFDARWDQQRAAGVQWAEFTTPTPPAKTPQPLAGGVQAQVVATMPPPHERYDILETLLNAIALAEDYIYIEDQYLRAPLLTDALIDRMWAKPKLVLVIVNNPVNEWGDPGCYQTYLEWEALKVFDDRISLVQLMTYADRDTDCTFCIDEVEGLFVPQNLHSKLVLIDDLYLQTGSANHNNRGLLTEGELATVVVNAGIAKQARHAIFANMLGPWYSTSMKPKDFVTAFDQAAYLDLLAYQAWEAEGFDLDLDGDPVPNWMIPPSSVYPLEFGGPDECLIEGVGPDVT